MFHYTGWRAAPLGGGLINEAGIDRIANTVDHNMLILKMRMIVNYEMTKLRIICRSLFVASFLA